MGYKDNIFGNPDFNYDCLKLRSKKSYKSYNKVAFGVGILALGVFVKQSDFDMSDISFASYLFDGVDNDILEPFIGNCEMFLYGVNEYKDICFESIYTNILKPVYNYVSNIHIDGGSVNQVTLAFLGGTFSNILAHELWDRRNR
ncbi:MAG: hypothetical protein K0B02_04550 [DPANN group archaeon]|nr:hypothetical protein [DPANN group archaeon]